MPALQPKATIVMNPNYYAEITAMLVELKVEADLLVLGNDVASGVGCIGAPGIVCRTCVRRLEEHDIRSCQSEI